MTLDDDTKTNLTTKGPRMRAALLESQRRVLERIATGAPLEDALLTLVRLIEEQARGMRCTVLLADTAQTRLHFAAAPSLSDDFRRSVEPNLAFGPDSAPCGRVAHFRQRMYIRDVATDPAWESLREVAARNDVRAIWSTPILSDDNRVLGTFAMYYREPRLPSDEHVQLIEMAVQMARVAIEARADEEVVGWIFDRAPRPMMILDIEGHIVRANRGLARALGYLPEDLRGRSVSEITEPPGAQMSDLPEGESDSFTFMRYRTREGKVLHARERSSVRRDGRGKARYIVMHFDELSEAGRDPLESLSGREREVLALVVAGATSKAIARQLDVSPSSVDTYRSRIMAKLGIEGVPGLVRFAIRQGIVSL